MTQHLPRLIVTLAVVALGGVLAAHAGETPGPERAVTVVTSIGAQVPPTERSPQVVLDAHPVEIGEAATALPTGAAISAALAAPTAAEPITLAMSKISANLLGLSWTGQVGPVDVVGSWDPAWRMAESFGLGLTTSTLEVPHYGVGMQIQYFAVTDGRTISPAEQNLGFNLRVAPVVPSFSTPEVWWGDPLQIQTTGIDPIREANRLEIPYQAVAPEATGFNNPPGAAKFFVPDDARGGYVFLHANNTTSSNGRWLTMRPRFTDELPPNAPITFSNITSVAWVSCGGGDFLYVAEDQGIWRLSMMKTVPTARKVGMVNPGRYFLSRAMSNNWVLFISGTQGNQPVQYFDGCAGSPLAGPWAQTTDNGFTRTFRATGIASRPAGDFAYLADASQGYTIRVPFNAGPGTSTITDRWGGNTVLSFADPAGIDAATSGALLVTTQSPMATYLVPAAGGATYQDQVSDRVIHSLQIDHDVSDASFHRNYATGNQGIALVRNRTTRMGGLAYALSDRVVVEPNRHYEATNPWPTRVLLANPPHDGVASPYPSQDQTADRILKLQFEGWGNVTQYLRVVDPPDTAPYAPVPTSPPSYYADDNTATQISANDWGLTTDPAGVDPAPQKCLAVTPSSDTVPATVYFKVPANFAGDNFRVEVSKQDWGTACNAANTVEFVTPRYTSWKRIFIERDPMFRYGGLLSADATPLATSVSVAKTWDPDHGHYRALDELDTVGLRVAIFDADQPYDGPNGVLHETACVRGWNSQQRGDENADHYTLDIGLVSGTSCLPQSPMVHSRTFVASHERDPDIHQWTFVDGRSAGIGVIGRVGGSSPCDPEPNQANDDSCYYDHSLGKINETFEDAFIEVVAPAAGRSVLPFVGRPWIEVAGQQGDDDASKVLMSRFSQIWFHHFVPAPGLSPPAAQSQNYFHFVAAPMYQVGSGRRFGLTSPLRDWIFIHVGSAEAEVGEQSGDLKALRSSLFHTSVHELGHIFWVNWCAATNKYHDSRMAWCSNQACGSGLSGSFNCPMNSGSYAQRTDGVERFCQEPAGAGDLWTGDLECIPSGQPPTTNGAIRTRTDPE